MRPRPVLALALVKAKGAATGVPPRPLATPLVVRLQRRDAPARFDATFGAATRNAGTRFTAESN
jgi:hypothetical protein